MDASDVVAGLRRRHERSQQPSSMALVATIDAVNETLDINKLDKSIIAYFGACMSPLERASLLEDVETVTALCTLLASVMSHIPGQYLRSKFTTISSIVGSILKGMQSSGQVAGQRAAMQCLVHCLRHVDISATWAPAKAPFLQLVRGTMDSNPKVRKIAADGLAEVMAAACLNSAVQAAASKELASGALPACPVEAIHPPEIIFLHDVMCRRTPVEVHRLSNTPHRALSTGGCRLVTEPPVW